MKLFISLFLISSFLHAKSIEVMSYNVENLFDTVHEEGKNDWAYLPLSYKGKKEACLKMKSRYRKNECLSTDWTDKHLGLKISQIKEVIFKERKRKPEVLALSEVENKRVISLLAKELGYRDFIISDSPDRRGIDLALLFDSSKDFKLLSQTEHKLEGNYFKKKPTRNILEAKFLIEGKHPLYIFVNHWPSLGNPDFARVEAAKKLKNRIESLKKADKNNHFIALGDFNTIPKLKKGSREHPFGDIFLKNSIMRDLKTEFLNSKKVSSSEKSKLPKGTYYYHRGKEWNDLDRVFISNSLLDDKGLDIEVESFQIYAPKFILTKAHGQMVPMGYNHQSQSRKTAGYSDHFPLIFKLKF